MRRRISLKLAAAAVGAAVCSAPVMPVSVAAEPVEWKMSTTYVEARKEIEFFRDFIERVGAKSNGELKINLFTGGSLGIKDVDILRALPPGNAIQLATTQPTYLSRDQPSFAIALPTGVLNEVAEIRKIDGALREIFDSVFKEWGIELIGFVGHPASEGQVYCKTPVRTLEELRTKKVRVWEKFQVDTLTKLGVAAQIIPQNELYLALASGVVDCTLYAAPWANSLSLHEVAPYASYLYPLVLPPLNILASQKAYEQLAPEEQEALTSAADEVWAETLELWVSGELDDMEIERFVDNGGTMLEPFSEEDRAEYAAAARRVWEAEAEAVGPEAVEARQKVLDALSSD